MKRLAVFAFTCVVCFAMAGCIVSTRDQSDVGNPSPGPGVASAKPRTPSGNQSGNQSDARSDANAAAKSTAKPGVQPGTTAAAAHAAGVAVTETNTNTGTAKSKVGRQTTLLLHPVDALEIGYSVRWATSINVGKDEKLAYVAVLDDLIVTVEHPKNIISAVSVSDGKLKWRTAIGLNVDVTFMPVRIGDKILVNTETHVYTLNADDGKYVSRGELRSPVNNGPSVVGDYAVFGGSDGMVFGYDSRVGYERWSYNLQTEILVSPITVANQVFVATGSGRYASFTGRDKEVLWQGRAFGKVSATPTSNGLGIFMACEDGILYSFNRSSGEDRWVYRHETPLTKSPIALRTTVYQPLTNGDLLALRGTDGKQLWTLQTKSRPIAQTSRGLIFVDDKKLEIRDPDTGKVIAYTPTKSLKQVIPIDASTLILIAADGRMMRLDVD